MITFYTHRAEVLRWSWGCRLSPAWGTRHITGCRVQPWSMLQEKVVGKLLHGTLIIHGFRHHHREWGNCGGPEVQITKHKNEKALCPRDGVMIRWCGYLFVFCHLLLFFTICCCVSLIALMFCHFWSYFVDMNCTSGPPQENYHMFTF